MRKEGAAGMGVMKLSDQSAENRGNLYIVFRIRDTAFSLGALDIRSIQKLPQKLLDVPNAPAYVRGSFKDQGEIFSVVDMRKLFDWETIQDEYQKFSDMIDARKRDHINWVNALRESFMEKKPFTLARNPHACALGLWRDKYQTEATSIQHALSRLDAPHTKLHAMADLVLEDNEKSEEAMNQLQEQLMPDVLAVLDELKEGFREWEFREMVLLLQGEKNVALIVDEVLGVEMLDSVSTGDAPLIVPAKSCTRGIRQRKGSTELVIDMDVNKLLAGLEVGGLNN